MGHVIGIDLGTTYSCVAYLEGGKPVVIPNLEGLPTTPSVVSFTGSGERLVGTLAWRQAVTNPANTFYAVKRLIGQKFASAQIQEALTRLPYELKEAPNGDVAVVLGDKTLSPPEISSMVLGYLKSCAESFFGEPVTQAVITVPAHFNDAQRQATKDAATICRPRGRSGSSTSRRPPAWPTGSTPRRTAWPPSTISAAGRSTSPSSRRATASSTSWPPTAIPTSAARTSTTASSNGW